MPQEKPQGEFASLWKEALAADTELEQVELNAALADIMSTKDATEQVTAVLARVAQLGPSPSPTQAPSRTLTPAPARSRRARTRRVLRLARRATLRALLVMWPPLATNPNPNPNPPQACVKRAAIFSAVVMQKHVVPMLEGVVDEVLGFGLG